MTKCIVLFFALSVMLAPLNLFSQQRLSEFNLRISKPFESYITSDDQGRLVCLLQSNKQFEVSFLHPDFSLSSSYLIDKITTDKSERIVGGILKPEDCFVYTFSTKYKSLSCLQVNKATGNASTVKMKVMAPNEQFLKAFEMEGHFYFLYVKKHTNTLRLLRVNGTEAEEINFEMEMPTFYASLTRGNEMVSMQVESEVGIEDMGSYPENDMMSCNSFKKLFHINGKIYFTFDEPSLTHLVIIDPISKTSEYKKLNFTLNKGNNSSQKQGNSFLNQNKLFRACYSPEQLDILILDLDSMNLVKSYSLFPEFEIPILNGPMVQETGVVGKTMDEKIIKTSNQYFKRLQEGTLAICVNVVDSNKIEMQVGSFELTTSYGQPGMQPGMPISFGMGFGGVGIGSPGMIGMGYPFGNPNYGYPGYYPNSSVQRLKSVYFKSLLSSSTFDHVVGNVPVRLKDKISDYELNAFKYGMPDVVKVTHYGDGVLYGYYMKGSKKFSIIGFKRQ